MDKPKVIFKITKEETGFSAHAEAGNCFINTEAETLDKLKANILESVNLSFEDEGLIYSIDEIEIV